MWLAVEGATCSGKSTMFNHLNEIPGLGSARIAHFGQPKDLTRDYVLDQYAHRWARNSSKHVLADRWHWGELTYAPIYRPDTNQDGFGLLGRAGWRWIEMFLASRGACVALTTADNETLAKRLADRGDDHVQDEATLMLVSSLYGSARRESITTAAIMNTSEVEYRSPEYVEFIDSLVEEAYSRAKLSRKIRNIDKNYIGVLQPDTLLVSYDSSNTPVPFAPTVGSDYDLILGALPDMFWRSVGMLKVTDDTAPEDIAHLSDQLGGPHIVAIDSESVGPVAASGVQVASLSVSLDHGTQVYSDAIVAAVAAQASDESER